MRACHQYISLIYITDSIEIDSELSFAYFPNTIKYGKSVVMEMVRSEIFSNQFFIFIHSFIFFRV